MAIDEGPKITVSEYEVDVLLSILYHWGTTRNTAGKFQDYIQKKTLYHLLRSKDNRDTAAELKQLETEFREKIPALLEIREQQYNLLKKIVNLSEKEIKALQNVEGKDAQIANQLAVIRAQRNEYKEKLAKKDAQIAKLEADRADKDAQTKVILDAIHVEGEKTRANSRAEGEKTRGKIKTKRDEDALPIQTDTKIARLLIRYGYSQIDELAQGKTKKDEADFYDKYNHEPPYTDKEYRTRVDSMLRTIRNWKNGKNKELVLFLYTLSDKDLEAEIIRLCCQRKSNRASRMRKIQPPDKKMKNSTGGWTQCS